MTNLLLLIFAPSKLAEKSEKHNQEYTQAEKSIKKIRARYSRIFIEIIFMSAIAILGACLTNYFGGITSDQLNILRFISATSGAMAGLGKLGWEIQTYAGETIPEKTNEGLFLLFYRTAIIGMLFSLAVNI